LRTPALDMAQLSVGPCSPIFFQNRAFLSGAETLQDDRHIKRC